MYKYKIFGIGLEILLSVFFVSQAAVFAKTDKLYQAEMKTVVSKEFSLDMWNWILFGPQPPEPKNINAVPLPEPELFPVQLIPHKEYPAEKIVPKEYPVQRRPVPKLVPVQ